MNKTISLGIAAMLATSGMVSALGTDADKPIPEEEQVEENIDQESEETDEEVELIQSLSLDEAIEHGLNSDFSLMDLQHQLDNAASMLAGMEDDYREFQRDLEDLQDEMDELRDYQRETGERTFQQRLTLQGLIEDLEEGIKELEDGIVQAEIGQVTGKYGQEATTESIKLSIISNFTSLKMAEEQLNFTKQTLENQQQQVDHLKRQYELGAIPRTEFETAKREITSLESQIAQSEDQLNSDTAVFALNIGIEYHSDLTLEELDLDQLELIEQETDTEELIENSYDMQTAKENLELARYDRDQVYADYEDDDADEHDLEQADIAVEQQLLEIEKLKVNGKNAIDSLYNDVKLQHQALKDAENEISYAEEDFANMKRRYEIGVISQADYELSEMSLKQATFNYEMEKYNYYLLLKQVELLESGVLPTN